MGAGERQAMRRPLRLASPPDDEAAAAELGTRPTPTRSSVSASTGHGLCSCSAGRSGGRGSGAQLARSLEQAVAAFDEIGSPGWADEARAELARVGARRPQASGELTKTEQRVAELAAEGLSNKQIAQALFVTVNTVEAHLSKAYAKLGVRSRSQLPGRLSRQVARSKVSGFPLFRRSVAPT